MSRIRSSLDFCFADLIFWAAGANSPDIGVYQKEDEERIALNEKLEEQKPAARRGETGALGGNSVTDRKPLTWENLW